MALEKEGRRERTGPGTDAGGLTQKARWVRFGSNVAVALVLATILVVVAVWVSHALLRGRARSDWTATGRFSLSPRTRALLKELPYDVRLTNLYSHTPEVPASEEQWRRVQDLLLAYDGASADVTVEAINPVVDVGRVETLVQRLRERYAEELAKPKALLEEFEKLRGDLSALLEEEAKRLVAAAEAWETAPPQVGNSMQMVAQRWQQLGMVGDFSASTVQSLSDQALPAYSTAVNAAKDFLRQAKENFAAVPGLYEQLQELAKDADIPASAKEILTKAEQTYGPLRERIETFIKQADDLPELELEDVRRDIGQGEVILIETPEKVHVISFEDVWVRARETGRRPDVPERRFAGEQAVSSALLGLVHEDKPAALFVTFGGPACNWGGPYARVAERLRKANFITQDWDLMREPTMPSPEHMTKPILILVPPGPPNPQRPSPPPTAEAYEVVIKAIENGAAAIVMAEPAGLFSPTVPYRDLFEKFGVEARFDAIAVHKMVVDARGTERALPQIEVTGYPEHAITTPLGALPTMFPSATPLMPKDELPDGVAVQAIVELPTGPDFWGETVVFQALRGEAERDEADDLIPTKDRPVPLAVAITKELPKKDTVEGEAEKAEDRPVQKLVFFGDGDFAQDRIAFYRTLFGEDLFPGNAELLLNSLLWVSGTDRLITVSPEALEARRIGPLGGWMLPLRILIIAGLPLAVGIAGVIVLVVRRR